MGQGSLVGEEWRKKEKKNEREKSTSGLRRQRAGMEPELEVRGAVLLLVACGGSSFRLSYLITNEFFCVFLCVHPGMDKTILFKIF